ncbi:hypothetical protein J6590_006695 [Homalodisca vitripennis]|nr:hypothetical protein J6590_006695 [Homalodisca vitripennis]
MVCPYHRYRGGLHLHDAIAVCALPPVVLASSRFRHPASLRHEESPSALPCRMSFADLQWALQSDPAAASAGAGIDQLSRSLQRTIRLPEGTPAEVSRRRVVSTTPPTFYSPLSPYRSTPSPPVHNYPSPAFVISDSRVQQTVG